MSALRSDAHDRFRPIADLHNSPSVIQFGEMAEPTPLQRYYLFHIAAGRWFGVTFAGAALLITVSNLPWLVRSGNPKMVAITISGGVGFLVVGLALYAVCTAVQRRYRAHIAQQID
jgi:hypothetical protein